MKNERIIVRASEELVEQLRQISEATDRPVSQIVREAVAEKIDTLKVSRPEIFNGSQVAV